MYQYDRNTYRVHLSLVTNPTFLLEVNHRGAFEKPILTLPVETLMSPIRYQETQGHPLFEWSGFLVCEALGHRKSSSWAYQAGVFRLPMGPTSR